MPACRNAALLLLLAIVRLIATAADTPLPLPQYIGQLEGLQRRVTSATDSNDVSSIARQLPEQWLVDADDRNFTVSSEGIRQTLLNYAEKRTPANLAAITSNLDLLVSNAHSMQSATNDTGRERDKLQEILARREFRSVKGQSWYDRWKRAVQRWLADLLERMVGSSAFPVVSRVVIWGLLVTAILVAIVFVIRTYRQSNIYPVFAAPTGTVVSKRWRDWQAEAQAAAEQGRWRDAVHLSYWAAIIFLESQGLWRPDPARTPREYLRLLPAGNQHCDSLRQLTRSFERVWYGTDTATAETFSGTRVLLERLGCH
jgi:hypothetical protein